MLKLFPLIIPTAILFNLGKTLSAPVLSPPDSMRSGIYIAVSSGPTSGPGSYTVTFPTAYAITIVP